MIQIDWDKAPEWANWWAMEKDNLCYFYQFEPKILGNDDGWTAQKTDWQLDTNSQSYNLSEIDWRNSLTRRPAAQMKKKYQITLRTIYGLLTIDDIEAKTKDEAIEIAKKLASQELDCAKVDEVYCYE